MLPRYNSISFQVYYVFTQCNPAFLILCLPSPSIWLCYNQFSCVLSCISFVNRRNVNQLIMYIFIGLPNTPKIHLPLKMRIFSISDLFYSLFPNYLLVLHNCMVHIIRSFWTPIFYTLCMPLGEPAQGRQQDPSGRPAEERDSTKVSCDVNLKRRKQHKP